MAKGIIDLRNRIKIAEQGGSAGLVDSSASRQVIDVQGSFDEKIEIQWQAREYDKKNRSTGWFVVVGGGASLFIALGILLQSYFFASFVTLAFLVYIMIEKKTPNIISCAVSLDGIRVGSSMHKFSELKSFWIFQELEPPELSLEFTKAFIPFVRIPIVGVNLEKTRKFLTSFIPEEKHPEFFSDQIARNL